MAILLGTPAGRRTSCFHKAIFSSNDWSDLNWPTRLNVSIIQALINKSNRIAGFSHHVLSTRFVRFFIHFTSRHADSGA